MPTTEQHKIQWFFQPGWQKHKVRHKLSPSPSIHLSLPYTKKKKKFEYSSKTPVMCSLLQSCMFVQYQIRHYTWSRKHKIAPTNNEKTNNKKPHKTNQTKPNPNKQNTTKKTNQPNKTTNKSTTQPPTPQKIPRVPGV